MLKYSIKTGELEAFLLKAPTLIMEYVSKALSSLARECTEKARNRGEDESWHNKTGNLRSSIGAAVYNQGVIFMQTTFDTILQGSKGSVEGRRLIQELVQMYKEAVAMVFVAAMDYADTVEAIESKDVLESTRIWAQSVVEERIKSAVNEAIKVINSWKL